jgi:hypothetical protein
MDALDLKAKTRLQIAEEIGISPKTLSRRLSKKKIKLPPGLIFPNVRKMIYKALGVQESPKKS